VATRHWCGVLRAGNKPEPERIPEASCLPASCLAQDIIVAIVSG